MAELFAIWKVKDAVDAASELCGGSKFGTSYYWSSSQFDTIDTFAWVLGFNDGSKDVNDKYSDSYSVCAVRAFN